ncbi:MAG: RluA family pseudouridine synthase [Deltaproteobacteria bacterium]|nr:RluA family pseudouridine synthase [Deltaproteobacteria bacterium]
MAKLSLAPNGATSYDFSAMRQIEITPADNGKKLENFLKKEFPIGYVRKLFRKNAVRVNGQRVRPNCLVRSGDSVQLYIQFEAQTKSGRSVAVKTPLPIVFEDNEILIIDKPAGLAVHEASGIQRRDTVIGILEAQYRAQPMRPRLVHRIDQDTSGLLLVAKNDQSKETLEGLFETKRVEKIYIALVSGRLPQPSGTIDFPLPGRDDQPVHAVTHYKTIQKFAETTLVEARIDTGRMHQIRLHFAKLGYPVVMDERHGDFAFNRRFRKDYGLKRQFLHAANLSLAYGGKKKNWHASLPEDLTDVLTQLSKENRAR